MELTRGQIIQSAAQADWVIVPRVTPTDEMRFAFKEKFAEYDLQDQFGGYDWAFNNAYEAMLAAAPPARPEPVNEQMLEALEPFARADRAIGTDPGPFRFETSTGHRLIEREDFSRASAALSAARAAKADGGGQ